MATANGFILLLKTERFAVFSECQQEDASFAEPVSEFSHSRNSPLLVIIVSPEMTITHIAKGKRGVRAGTDLRRLNVVDSEKLAQPVAIDEIISRLPNRHKSRTRHKLQNGGLLSPKAFFALVDALILLAPSLGSRLRGFGQQRAERLQNLSEQSKHALASQKLAISTAVTLAGLSRDILQEWDPGQEAPSVSFLDGLPCTRLREDPMVINDLLKFPGYDLIKTLPYPAAIFQGERTRLTIILANRLPLEEQTGTDLIYFNETFRSFVMVQYKAMERENDETVFRLPNRQLSDEVGRMNTLLTELRQCDGEIAKEGFRLNDNPFYIKLCPRIVLEPDDSKLVPGMYIPLDYWNALSIDPCLNGPRGGTVVSYGNVGRYMDNTEFASLVSKAWIGSTQNQSRVLEVIIRTTLESGKAIAIGVKTDIPPQQLPQRDDGIEPTTVTLVQADPDIPPEIDF